LTYRAALISLIFIDCIGPSLWLKIGLGSRDHKQPIIRRRWTKEGVDIDQDIRRELNGAGDMVDSPSGIVTHDDQSWSGRCHMRVLNLQYLVECVILVLKERAA